MLHMLPTRHGAAVCLKETVRLSILTDTTRGVYEHAISNTRLTQLTPFISFCRATDTYSATQKIPFLFCATRRFITLFTINPTRWHNCLRQVGRGFDSRCCHWNFSFIKLHYGPGVDSASNRNEYQEYFLELKAAGTQG